MERHTFKQLSLRRTCSVLAVSAIALVGCGTSVPDAGGNSTTTKTATTERPTDTTAPPTTVDSGEITVGKLEELLPTVDQIGADYRIDGSTDDGDDPELDAALEKACPDAAAILDDGTDDRPSASRSFTAEDRRSVEVELEPGASLTSRAKDDVDLDELIDAVNDCEVITYTDKEGIKFEIELEVQKDTDFGDEGIAMIMRMSVSDDSLPKPIVIEAGFRKYLVGDVGVSVSAMSGFDPDTLEEVDGDFDLIDELSEKLEKDVVALSDRS